MEEVEEKSSYKAILKETRYLRFIIANLISRFGDSVDSIAFEWMVYKITNSASLMALIFGVNSVPTMLFQPFAGAFVEKFSKKKVIILCDIGRGITVALVALLYFTGKITVPVLFISTFINSTFEAFRSPAAQSATPILLSKENYSYGMSLFQSTARIVEIVGLAVAGAIVGFMGVTVGILIDAVSFFLCALIEAFINFKGDVTENIQFNFKSYFEDLKNGFSYLKKNKVVLNATIFAPLVNLFLVPINTLSLVYINSSLHLGASAYSAVCIAITVGLAVGSFVLPKIKEKMKAINIIISSGILLGACYGLYYILPYFKYALIPVVALAFGIGLSVGIISMIASIIFMEKIDKDYIARVSSILGALSMSSMPFGSFIVSGICMVLSTSQIFLLMGILIIITFVLQFFNKTLKEL